MPDEYEWPAGTTTQRRRQVAAVLWALREDGPFKDESGRATGQLLEALKRRRVVMEPHTLPPLLRDLERGGRYAYDDLGYIEREMTGKRTRFIGLAVDPDDIPFPACPWPTEGPTPVAETYEPEPVADEPVVDEPDAIEDAERSAADLDETEFAASTELVPYTDPTSVPDKLILALELINDALIQLAVPNASELRIRQLEDQNAQQARTIKALTARVRSLADA